MSSLIRRGLFDAQDEGSKQNPFLPTMTEEVRNNQISVPPGLGGDKGRSPFGTDPS